MTIFQKMSRIGDSTLLYMHDYPIRSDIRSSNLLLHCINGQLLFFQVALAVSGQL